MAFSPSDYRRLTPAELKRLGYGEGSKRRVLSTVKKVTKATPSLTDRRYAELKLSSRFGKQTSKEQYRKLVDSGKVKPETKQARAAKEGRFVRGYISEIAPKHLRLINKWHEDGYNGLTDNEKVEFGRLFKLYPRDAVRQALGSAPQDQRVCYGFWYGILNKARTEGAEIIEHVRSRVDGAHTYDHILSVNNRWQKPGREKWRR
jgi:hypothetical protein